LNKAEKIARIATLATVSFLMAIGLYMALAQLRPFWIDEWRLIYNLKFKSAPALWEPLSLTQQFPRVYLELLKAFTSSFDYSYTSLRLPALIIATVSVFLCFSLLKSLLPPGKPTRFLFVMILVSSFTFTDYIVQAKQYEMDILLSLTAIWQLLQLLQISSIGIQSKSRYLLLCISFAIVPFFSYTYPIAAAPIFIIVLAKVALLYKRKNKEKAPELVPTSSGGVGVLPLLISMVSIIIFYRIDVSQLMADKQMIGYWQYKMMNNPFNLLSLSEKCWWLFAEVGAGFVFEILFGIVGIASFFYGLYTAFKNLFQKQLADNDLLLLYCAILLALVIALIIAGKLPVEPKFNAFTVPAISILIITLLNKLLQTTSTRKFATGAVAILYAGVIINIYTTCYALFFDANYARRMNIYRNTEKAIQLAQAEKLPIIINPGVAFPDQITKVYPFLTNITADEVLKTFPSYKVNDSIPVYAINDLADVKEFMAQLPPDITTVLAGDGQEYRVIKR